MKKAKTEDQNDDFIGCIQDQIFKIYDKSYIAASCSVKEVAERVAYVQLFFGLEHWAANTRI